jgi:hypothetical protein
MAKENNDRFIFTYVQGGGGVEGVKILVDKMTGVQYIWTTGILRNANGGMGGLTVLVGQDGKPLLYQPPTE